MSRLGDDPRQPTVRVSALSKGGLAFSADWVATRGPHRVTATAIWYRGPDERPVSPAPSRRGAVRPRPGRSCE